MTDDTDTTDETPALHRDGLPFLVAAHGWCAAAGAAGAFFPDALEALLAEAERPFAPREPQAGDPRFCVADALRSLTEPDWAAWLKVAVPTAEVAAASRHHLEEALWRRVGRGPDPRSPGWEPDHGLGDGPDVGPWRLRWITSSHEVILGPSLPLDEGGAGHGWAFTVYAPCTPSYRTEAAEAAMRSAEERLGLVAAVEADEAAR